MKNPYRMAMVTGAVALCAALFLASVAGQGQASTDEQAKAAARARAIARTFELNASTLTVFDRQGNVVNTVGPRGLYTRPVFSPDGKRLAVVKRDEHDLFGFSGVAFLAKVRTDVWVLDVATGNGTQITSSQSGETAQAPVWSPDGSQIAYVALRSGNEGLYRKASSGQGIEELLYQLPGFGIVLTDWSLDGRFLTYYSSDPAGSILSALPLTGKRTPIEIARSESPINIIEARLSPDSRFLAYRSNESGKNEIYVRRFDPSGGKEATPASKWQVSDQGGLGMASWRSNGKELYYMAADRGVISLQVSTSPTFEFGHPKVLFKAPRGPLGSISFDNERIVFALPPAPQLRQITVFDRQGNIAIKVGEPGLYVQPELSPDGTRVAVVRADPNTGSTDIWSFNMATGKGTPVTNDAPPEDSPIWSPDGSQVLYVSTRGGYAGIYRKAWDGSGSEELLFRYTLGASIDLTDMSPDGKLVTFHCDGSTGPGEPGGVLDGVVFVVPLTGTDPLARKAIEFARDEFTVFMGRLSPDSRFMAYISNESERNEVYVRPFDSSSGTARAEGKWQVSKDGSTGMIVWRADSKEMYYLQNDLQTGDALVMAVDLSTTPTFQAGTPKLLFRLKYPLWAWGDPGQWKNISGDGQHFVFVMSAATPPAP